jgi:hypothetical protein
MNTFGAGILAAACLSLITGLQSPKMAENAKKGPKTGSAEKTGCDGAKPTPDSVLSGGVSTTVFFLVALGLSVRERGPAA